MIEPQNFPFQPSPPHHIQAPAGPSYSTATPRVSERMNPEVQKIYEKLRDRKAERISKVLRNDPPEAERIDMELRNKAQEIYQKRRDKAERIDKERRDKAERRRNRSKCEVNVPATVFGLLIIGSLCADVIYVAVKTSDQN